MSNDQASEVPEAHTPDTLPSERSDEGAPEPERSTDDKKDPSKDKKVWIIWILTALLLLVSLALGAVLLTDTEPDDDPATALGTDTATKDIRYCGDISDHLAILNEFDEEEDGMEYLANNPEIEDVLTCMSDVFLACEPGEINISDATLHVEGEDDTGTCLSRLETDSPTGIKCAYGSSALENIIEQLLADQDLGAPLTDMMKAIIVSEIIQLLLPGTNEVSSSEIQEMRDANELPIDFSAEFTLPPREFMCDLYPVDDRDDTTDLLSHDDPADDAPDIEPAPRADDAGAEEADVRAVETGSNQFAFDLYHTLRDAEPDSNMFFSPYSITTALSMVAEGARGNTLEEILEVFGLPQEDLSRRSAMAALHNRLNPETPTYDLNTANALWLQQDYPVADEYIATIGTYYLGRAQNVDFVNAPEEARSTINDWVAERTNDLINELFPRGSLDSSTRLALTNTIYFKGDWVQAFDPNRTQDEEFRIDPDTTVDIPLMRQSETRFGYYEDEDVQVLELPYQGGAISMLVVLPADEDINALEQHLTLEKFTSWRDGLRHIEVDEVYLPSFELDTGYALNNPLEALGMPAAFNTGLSDFSGINPDPGLYLQTVVHEAFITVDEEGTEAAAATGASSAELSAPLHRTIFRADHPFLFFIQEQETGTILFMGRVHDPR